MHTIWLARHGNREDFVDPSWRETAERPHDPDLSPDGVEQARHLGVRAAALGVDRIVTSPFLRTVHTAHLVAEQTGRAVELEPGLGEWMNLAPSALTERFPHVDATVDPCLRPPFPETKQESFDRVADAVRCLAQRHAGQNASLLLVGHGITVQGALLGLVGDVPDEGVPLASLTTVVRGDGDNWHLAGRNDTSHLGDGQRASDRLH